MKLLYTLVLAALAVGAFAQPLQLSLERLATTGSVLMIGAHPDDENTALLAYLALGRRLRTGYLSLTRGEGGQNVIGPEQGNLLGLIREQELLAARQWDGAEQFFTTAVDFGYSKSPAETLRKWDRKRVLSEIVEVIQDFQPDVVILRWSGTPADGHGHHQAAGILGAEAVQASSWKVRRVYIFRRKGGSVKIDTGAYDPLLGRSYAEIAGLASSQHRSQAMGSAEVVGPSVVYLDGAGKLEGFEPDAARFPAQIAGLLQKAASSFQPKRPAETIPALLQARRLLRSVSGDLAARKLVELDEAILRCAGVFLEAVAPKPYVLAGAEVPVRVQAVNRSSVAMRLEAVDLGGNTAVQAADMGNNVPVQREIRWRAKSPVPMASFRIRVGAESILARRPIVYRFVDKVLGQRSQTVAIVPPVSVAFRDTSVLYPDESPREVMVRVKSYSGKVEGKLSLALPDGWSAEPDSLPFQLGRDEDELALRFHVTPPRAAATVSARAVASVAGQQVDSSVVTISYPHIPTQIVVQPSAVGFTRANVRVVARNIGYVEGAGDQIPAALRQLGCQVTFLTAEHLSTGDLNVYDAIVTGVRAFNLREDLRASMGRLNEYIHEGGSLIVQYNTASPSLGTLGPFPLRIGSARVSVEEAPVNVIQPKSTMLRFPNPITAADFDRWVQERGLYFPSEWDRRYEAPIASHDPGENPLPGGILFAKYGEGAYIYTSYSWFRQLPAGVAGAYRIFANMLSQ